MPLDLSVQAVCDNALAIYVDDDRGQLRLIRAKRPLTGQRITQSEVIFVETNVWELAYFYVVTWSDHQIAQWMKAHLSAGGAAVSTGDPQRPVWSVTPIGVRSSEIVVNTTTWIVTCSDAPPSADAVSVWLSTRRNWVAPARTDKWGALKPGRGAVWYNSSKQSGSGAPFDPGWDHGEPLVFRLPLIVLASCFDLYFPFDQSAQLMNQSRATAQLQRLAEQLKLVGTSEIKKVVIAGHTSQQGTAEYNMKLSQERAEYVKGVLTKNNVPQAVECKGYGFTQLKNWSDVTSDVNRRVEIELVR